MIKDVSIIYSPSKSSWGYSKNGTVTKVADQSFRLRGLLHRGKVR